LISRVCVEELALEVAGEKGLMVMRTVEVEEAVSQLFQCSKCGRGSVDELAISAGGGDGTLDEKLAVGARVNAEIFEGCVEFLGAGFGIEDGLDRALVGAKANQRAISFFSDEEFQSANNDGLSRTCFTGDDGEPASDVPVEFLNEGEVPNP
jgi:hypothetical protein